MSVDIDYFTLHRLTELAFKFDTGDKTQYRNTILSIIKSKPSEEAANTILQFIEDQYNERKLIFAVSTADPKAALKPKTKPFRRVGATEADVVPVTELTSEEMERRQEASKISSERLASFYKNAMMVSQEDDEDDEEDASEEELEAIMKLQILNSVEMAPVEEDPLDNGYRYGIPFDPSNDDS